MKTLTIVSPAFQEEAGIENFCTSVVEVMEPLKNTYDYKILIIVDKCPDRTLEILKEIARTNPRIGAIGMSSRFGHQMCLLAGIDYTDTDLIIMMDCDLQHPPALIPRLLEEHEKGYDVVYTVKKVYNSTSLFRRYSSRGFYKVLNWLSQVPIHENASDFRLISRRVANIFKTQLRERTLFMRGLLSWIGFPATSIEFDVPNRFMGESKYSLTQLFRLALHGVLSFSKKPLRLATITGLIFACLGFLYGGYITILFFFNGSAFPPGWTTLAVMGSILSGIQLICLGVIGEYIGAIFDEVKNRPHYIVEEKINN